MFAAAYSVDDPMILQAIWGKEISGFDSEETKINSSFNTNGCYPSLICKCRRYNCENLKKVLSV